MGKANDFLGILEVKKKVPVRDFNYVSRELNKIADRLSDLNVFPLEKGNLPFFSMGFKHNVYPDVSWDEVDFRTKYGDEVVDLMKQYLGLFPEYYKLGVATIPEYYKI
jgi:hypothetical protein